MREERSIATAAPPAAGPDADDADPVAPDATPPARTAREKNRALALALGVVAASVFATAVLMTLLVHYVETHNVIPGF